MPKIKKIRPNADAFHLRCLKKANEAVEKGDMTLEEGREFVVDLLERLDRGEFDIFVEVSVLCKPK